MSVNDSVCIRNHKISELRIAHIASKRPKILISELRGLPQSKFSRPTGESLHGFNLFLIQIMFKADLIKQIG